MSIELLVDRSKLANEIAEQLIAQGVGSFVARKAAGSLIMFAGRLPRDSKILFGFVEFVAAVMCEVVQIMESENKAAVGGAK